MPRCQSSVTVVWRVLLVMALSRRLVACVGSQVEEREGQARHGVRACVFKVAAKDLQLLFRRRSTTDGRTLRGSEAEAAGLLC